MEFHMINTIYAALPMRAQTEKTIFLCKDDCTLTNFTKALCFAIFLVLEVIEVDNLLQHKYNSRNRRFSWAYMSRSILVDLCRACLKVNKNCNNSANIRNFGTFFLDGAPLCGVHIFLWYHYILPYNDWYITLIGRAGFLALCSISGGPPQKGLM